MADLLNPQNRRRVPRRQFDTQVGLLLHGKYGLAKSYQVGEGGMMISATRPLSEGTHLVLSFFLPASTTLILVRGIVRSQAPANNGLPVRYGVEFMNLEFQSKRMIRNFVAAATRTHGHIV